MSGIQKQCIFSREWIIICNDSWRLSNREENIEIFLNEACYKSNSFVVVFPSLYSVMHSSKNMQGCTYLAPKWGNISPKWMQMVFPRAKCFFPWWSREPQKSPLNRYLPYFLKYFAPKLIPEKIICVLKRERESIMGRPFQTSQDNEMEICAISAAIFDQLFPRIPKKYIAW